MTVINIRGSSGSGKSTLIHNFLRDFHKEPIFGQLGNWKKSKIIGYQVYLDEYHDSAVTTVIGSYETQCGGCDSLSYKGSHDDIEAMVREYMMNGNVIFEGLTISSTLTRWRRISDQFPGEFVWAFMMTSEEECYERIMARNGGREPKRNNKGIADYQIKYRGCMRHLETLESEGQRVLRFTSDDEGYLEMLGALQ